MSSFVPNWRQPVGHALMHAGSRPDLTRSTHSVHLAILPVLAWNFGTSKGQPVAQKPQPMHASGLTSTMPFSYWTIAPGAGQAASHALQPMQVVVSMNFETTGSWRIPGAPPQRDAEERRISRLWAAMAVLLRLLELDEEGLVLRRPGVRVTGGRRQQVGQRP